ncbi:mariner Mos1 transposase [Trichonephila clavipes]|nr:mariner Mos1 transposase [Trichonephila clavipes]
MVLKANDRRTSCPCHDEFRGPRSDYVRQVALENNNNITASKRHRGRLRVETINTERYCNTSSKLKNAIRKKQPGLLISSVLLLDDNVRLHSATATQNCTETLGWERLHHLPYSPDIAPSDFHLFPTLKKNLAGRCFGSNDEVKHTVKRPFRMQNPEFFWRTFLNLSSELLEDQELTIDELIEMHDQEQDIEELESLDPV